MSPTLLITEVLYTNNALKMMNKKLNFRQGVSTGSEKKKNSYSEGLLGLSTDSSNDQEKGLTDFKQVYLKTKR